MLLITGVLGYIAGILLNLYVYRDRKEGNTLVWTLNLIYRRVEYIITPVLTCIISVASYSVYGNSFEFLKYLFLGFLLVTVTVTDIKKRLIPDIPLIIGGGLGFAFLLFCSDVNLLGSILGCVIAGGILWLLYIITRGGIGLGDVKLYACIGLFLGIERVLSSMLIATIISGLTGLVLIVINRDNRKKEFPFAPFAALATLLLVLV